MKFLDCTLRDGGYYNGWDFSVDLINDYLEAMQSVGVDVVELGFRSVRTQGFKGPCAFTKDEFVRSLRIPKGVKLGVMINASELIDCGQLNDAITELVPVDASKSPVDVVRVACHVHEFETVLPVAQTLKKLGYVVGFNLMQIAERSETEIKALGREASRYPVDVLYFADSMGSMVPNQTAKIIQWIGSEWKGDIGIHTHDNLGLALSNTLHALNQGVTWVDSTVTGMGRGPGNARTEELAIEIAERRGVQANLVPLMALLREHFKPMQARYGWGTNPYYYLAGKYGIHPTYIQEMLGDSRYSEEDVLAVIEHLRVEGGKRFSLDTLDAARHFYVGEPKGQWAPRECFAGREVLLLGTGPGVARHRAALEQYIRDKRPLVVALNTQSEIDAELIDLRVACHPVRLLADCEAHTKLPQPLITPYSMLPEDVRYSLEEKQILDFGLTVQPNRFGFEATYCTLPTSLVVGYALAVATSGCADRILMAGFDGYSADDPRSREMNQLLDQYHIAEGALSLTAITPSRYGLYSESVYAL